MVEKIHEPVSVYLSYNHIKNQIFPHWILWKGRMHQVVKVGLHHTYHEGRTLYHVFSVATKTLFFRIVLNTENLFWRLEEISDGLPD